jgi:hypothetical protein
MFYISFHSLIGHDLYRYNIIYLLTKILENGFFFLIIISYEQLFYNTNKNKLINWQLI